MSEFKSNFYYNNQLRNYVLQFLAIFSGMQVRVGKLGDTESRLINVQVKNGSSDRIVADIKAENTQNKPLRLPIIAGTLTNVNLAPSLRKGVGQVKRSTYMPTGHVFPDDITVVEMRMPVPYIASFDLSIWASNQDQHYQIIEQILMLFDPILHIQTSDEVFDVTRLTTCELVGINFEETEPGVDRRVIQTTLSFEVPVYMSAPAAVHSDFVKNIFLRIGAISAASQTDEEIISELDQQGIEYDHVFDLDEVDLSKPSEN